MGVWECLNKGEDKKRIRVKVKNTNSKYLSLHWNICTYLSFLDCPIFYLRYGILLFIPPF